MKSLSLLVALMLVPVLCTGCLAVAAGGAATGGAVAAGIDAAETQATAAAVADSMIGASVKVTFASPNDLTTVRTTAKQFENMVVQGSREDSLHVPAVTSVVGRVAASGNNAMVLHITETNGASGKKDFGGKYVVTVQPDNGTSVQVLSLRPERPHRVLLGAIIGLVVGTGLLFYLAFANAST